MLRDGLEDWMVGLLIFAAIAIAMLGAGWSQFLEYKRRSQAMDVIKAVIEAGKEPAPILYEQLAKAGQSKPPWTEVVIFTALGVAFWIAYAQGAPDDKVSYLVIAASMSVTAIGCLVLAIMHPDRKRGRDDDAG